MTSRLNIFAKLFLAFCALAIVPLLVTTGLLVSNYQEMTVKVQTETVANAPPGMPAYVGGRVADATREAYLLMAMILLIGVVLVVFAALVFSRLFTRPIDTLLQTTNTLAKGDFGVRLQTTRRDEFGALAAGFNRMADQLEEAQHRLEQANAALEHRVAQRTAELEMTNLQLRAATAKTEESVRLKGEFLANLSHELRTPLHVVLGYAQLLADGVYGPLAGRQTAALGKIRANAQILRRLINDIVDLLRAETGRLSLSIEEFDPRETIESIMSTLRPLFAAKGLAFAGELAPDLPPMQSDRAKLQIVLYNLLANALKFTPAGSVALRAGVGPRDGWLTFEVADTGPGIAPDQLPRLFQSFRQLDGSTTREAGGAGIGLSLTRQLVELLGGDIAVESEPGRGSVFRVALPAVVSLVPAGRPATAPKIVLSIDDDPDLLEVLAASLEPAGYRVVACTDGDLGLAKARELRPYAVTLDIRLPVRDGWSILEELRRDPELAGIPVIVLTVTDDRALGERYGVSGYITKPFRREQLIERLDSLNEARLQ